MGEQCFPTVIANSKKMAKQLAAEVAVKQLLGENALCPEKVKPRSVVAFYYHSMPLVVVAILWSDTFLYFNFLIKVEPPAPTPVAEAPAIEYPPVPELSMEDIKMAQASGVGDYIKYLNANPVSGLLEYSRAKGFAAEFKMVSQSGPPHDPK